MVYDRSFTKIELNSKPYLYAFSTSAINDNKFFEKLQDFLARWGIIKLLVLYCINSNWEVKQNNYN